MGKLDVCVIMCVCDPWPPQVCATEHFFLVIKSKLVLQQSAMAIPLS